MILILLLLSFLSINFTNSIEWQFPEDFKFGVATSAYQIEGGWIADGKGVSIWDTFTNNRSDAIKDNSNANVACDSYNKWEEDVMLIKNLGVNFYRFSLSWTRLFPQGYTRTLNSKGVEYYNRLIDKLIENEIEPLVTIYHWDLPQIFSPLGGWSNPFIIDMFANYARKVFQLFGDRVKTWITINEPRLICQKFKGLVGDVTSVYPFGMVEYLCAKNVIKAHAAAYHIYNKEFRLQQKGRISLTLDFSWFEPENSSNPADVAAAERFLQFQGGLFANPILNFDYPRVVKDRIANRSRMEGFSKSRLPELTFEEKLYVRGTYDFLGINHYPVYMVRSTEEPSIADPSLESDIGGYQYFHPTWESTAAPVFKVVPWALRRMLQWVKKTYHNPEILILENGYANADDLWEDHQRINYYRKYLNATLQTIYEDGVNVKAYTAWSLMDNFEWGEGYTVKFGLYHVNFTDTSRTRTPKASVNYFKNVTRTRRID